MPPYDLQMEIPIHFTLYFMMIGLAMFIYFLGESPLISQLLLDLASLQAHSV